MSILSIFLLYWCTSF